MKIRWYIITITVTVVLAVLIGANQIYEQKVQKEPLNALMQEKSEITIYNVIDGDPQIIEVELGEISDFPMFISTLNNDLTELLGRDKYVLRIKTPKLTQSNKIYEKVLLALYEGERLGNYVEMSNIIDSVMLKEGISDYRLTIDNQAIYFQSNYQGNNFYKIIPRNTNEEAVI